MTNQSHTELAALLRDLTEHASKMGNRTAVSLESGLMRLADRACTLLAALESPERVQGEPLQWVLNGDKQCGYNNWLAETTFGRILITWKGWKEDWNMGVSVDEFPGDIPVLHGSPDEVKDAAEEEFFRRVRAATPSPQAEKQPLSDERRNAMRWEMLAHMASRQVPLPVIAHYISRPDRLDYAAELRAAHGIVTKESSNADQA